MHRTNRKFAQLSFLIVVVLVFVSFVGCGGGEQSSPGSSTQPPEPPKPFAPWQGLIALRYAPNYDNACLWFISPDNTSRLITDNAYWYGPIRWSPDNDYLAFPKSSSSYALADRTGAIIKSYPVGGGETIAWSPDSVYFLAGRYYNGIWKFGIDGTYDKLLTSYSATYDHSLTVSKDGQWVYFIHHEWGSMCWIYRIRTASLLAGASYADCELLFYITTGHDEEIQFLEIPGGKFIMAYGYDTAIYVMDPQAKTLIKKMDQGLTYMRISPDGKYLATLYYNSFSVIDLSTWQIRYGFDSDYTKSFESFAWSPNSDALVVAEDDGNVDIWRFDDQRLQTIFEASKSIAAKSAGVQPRSVYGEQTVSVTWIR
jgi:WD40 repeat protein